MVANLETSELRNLLFESTVTPTGCGPSHRLRPTQWALRHSHRPRGLGHSLHGHLVNHGKPSASRDSASASTGQVSRKDKSPSQELSDLSRVSMSMPLSANSSRCRAVMPRPGSANPSLAQNGASLPSITVD